MGEAKRRAKAAAEWRDGLTESEKVAADLAIATYRQFVEPAGAMGMCYRLAFFLTELIAEQGVEAQPIVGYVNDGTGHIMMSHAWVELNDRRIDLSLAFTEHPEAQLPGEVLVLGRVIRPGTHYTYHLEQSPEALAELESLRAHREFAEIVERKEAEHLQMVKISAIPEARLAYLNAAPDGLDFGRMKAIVQRRSSIS